MTALVVLAAASDPRPDDNNVVAGWVGFAVLIALIIAVVFILRSFTKQLKKVDRARDEGVFGDEDDAEEESEDSGTPPTHRQS
jgi:F0F1-type ATP synthase membrane subunit b/b'